MIIMFSAVLISISLYSALNKKRLYSIYIIILLILGVISAIRYDVGTDYFAYAYIYNMMPLDIIDAINAPLHGEIGFKLIIALFKKIGFSFQFFLAFFSTMGLSIFHKITKDYSPNPVFSITIFFHLYYPIYINSGIRQGFVMLLYLYGITYYLSENDYFKFIILTLLASTIHFSAILGLLIIPFYKIMKYSMKSMNNVKLFLYICIVLSAILLSNLVNLGNLLISILPISESYEFGTGVNLLSLTAKLTMLIIISFLYINDKNKKSQIEEIYYASYLLGSIIYFLFATTPIVSRLLNLYTIVEIVLIPITVFRKQELLNRVLHTLMIVSLLALFFTRDLKSFTEQQKYYETGVANYKYFTIFDKYERFDYKPPHRLESYLPESY